MNAKELAEKLNGREYLNEITKEEAKAAEAFGLVAVFGYSDDNLEFRGAIDDEVGAWDNAEIPIVNGKLLQTPCDSCSGEGCPLLEAAMKNARFVRAEYTSVWHITADFPHEKFTIYEDGEENGEGIVFDVKDL